MTSEVLLREVRESDLPIFFEQQLNPEATQMAAFPSRGHAAFHAHWAKCMADSAAILKTIVADGKVAGNIVCWELSGEHNVGYWLGRDFWNKGIATAALFEFLREVRARPLHARVAKHNLASIRVLQKCGFAIAAERTFCATEGLEQHEYIMKLKA